VKTEEENEQKAIGSGIDVGNNISILEQINSVN